jgi:RHS repeat-associated protein
LAKIAHIDPSGKVLESEASTYDKRDRRLTRTRADGSTDLFRYDPAGQVTAAAYGQDKVASALAEPQENQNNPVNPENPANPANPVQKSATEEQKDFTPNQIFVYDEAGNRLEVTENGMTTKYQPNDANQYAKIAHGTEVVEPEYDPQGNLLHDATRKYTWDADIHLMSVTTQGSPHTPSEEPGTTGAAPRGATGPVASEQASGLPHVAPQNAPSKTTTTRFLYDPLHRRIARIKDSGEVTLYTYEGWNVVAEKTTSTAPQLDTENLELETRYVWGEDLSGTLQGAGGIGGLLRSTIVEAKPNGTRKTEHEHTFSYDSNGNIILLTGAKAQETARYSYDAFGKTLTATGSAAQTNRYQFSTKPVEEESGLVYYGYRWYDPVTGRWPSRDPLGENGGINLFLFSKNSPLFRFDLLGLVVVQQLNSLITDDYGGRGGGAAPHIVRKDVLVTETEAGECEVQFIGIHWRGQATVGARELYSGPGFVQGFDLASYKLHKNRTVHEKYLRTEGLSYEGVRIHEQTHLNQINAIATAISQALTDYYQNAVKTCSCAEAHQIKQNIENEGVHAMPEAFWRPAMQAAFPAQGGFALNLAGEYEATLAEWNYYDSIAD